jgi:hypothetical protein
LHLLAHVAGQQVAVSDLEPLGAVLGLVLPDHDDELIARERPNDFRASIRPRIHTGLVEADARLPRRTEPSGGGMTRRCHQECGETNESECAAKEHTQIWGQPWILCNN